MGYGVWRVEEEMPGVDQGDHSLLGTKEQPEFAVLSAGLCLCVGARKRRETKGLGLEEGARPFLRGPVGGGWECGICGWATGSH